MKKDVLTTRWKNYKHVRPVRDPPVQAGAAPAHFPGPLETRGVQVVLRPASALALDFSKINFLWTCANIINNTLTPDRTL